MRIEIKFVSPLSLLTVLRTELNNALNGTDSIEKYKDAFLSEMANDFNTPNAFTVLYQVLKDDT